MARAPERHWELGEQQLRSWRVVAAAGVLLVPEQTRWAVPAALRGCGSAAGRALPGGTGFYPQSECPIVCNAALGGFCCSYRQEP